jgi:FKBP-type peptidyl-prolyl cis-trans isomerase FkpA
MNHRAASRLHRHPRQKVIQNSGQLRYHVGHYLPTTLTGLPMRTLHFFMTIAALSVSTQGLAASTETLPSGVVVTQIKPGQGATPTANSTVRVHYRGTLPNGTEFDSSYKRNEPISFPLQGVIPCWTQGVQKMKVGGKARLTCPAATGYGARGVPGVIPPNTDLTFEVELLGIER